MSDVPISISWVDVPAIRKKLGQDQGITSNSQITTENLQKSRIKNNNNLENVTDFFNNDNNNSSENINFVRQKPTTSVKSPKLPQDNFIQFEDNANIDETPQPVTKKSSNLLIKDNTNVEETPKPVKKSVNLLKEDNSENKSTDNKLFMKIGLGIVAFIGLMAQLKK